MVDRRVDKNYGSVSKTKRHRDIPIHSRVESCSPVGPGRDRLRMETIWVRNDARSQGEENLTQPGSPRYRTSSRPGRPLGDVPNVANSLGIPMEPARDPDSTIDTNLSLRTNGVRCLQVQGIGMAA